MKRESNKTYAKFKHKGKSYTIHQRTNILSDGSPFMRRFILDENGAYVASTLNVRDARKILNKLNNS